MKNRLIQVKFKDEKYWMIYNPNTKKRSSWERDINKLFGYEPIYQTDIDLDIKSYRLDKIYDIKFNGDLRCIVEEYPELFI